MKHKNKLPFLCFFCYIYVLATNVYGGTCPNSLKPSGGNTAQWYAGIYSGTTRAFGFSASSPYIVNIQGSDAAGSFSGVGEVYFSGISIFSTTGPTSSSIGSIQSASFNPVDGTEIVSGRYCYSKITNFMGDSVESRWVLSYDNGGVSTSFTMCNYYLQGIFLLHSDEEISIVAAMLQAMNL
jgi:hypothetical protein